MNKATTDGYSSETATNATECTTYSTCARCTNAVLACNWSIDKQTCGNANETTANLTVDEETSCPRFTINDKLIVANSQFQLRVKISNDRKGFVELLKRQKTISCSYETLGVGAALENDEIVCTPLTWNDISIGSYIYVVIAFDNVTLQFDNGADHYFGVFRRHCDSKHNDGCVDCSWDTSDYRYYLMKCSGKNKCLVKGQRQVFETRTIRDNFSKTENNKTVRVECPEFRVRSFEPVYGLRNGETKIKIHVSHHGTLIDHNAMVVTVADRNCTNPTTLDDETITCTVVRSSDGSRSGEGPVKLTYVSTTDFALISSRSFRFVDPEVASFRPNYGSVKGGTLIRMSGRFLDASVDGVRVFVDETIPCDVTAISATSITCRTGPSKTLSAGRVKVDFGSGQHAFVDGALFEYVDDPIIDAGQTFSGIASGGTRFSVRGRNFGRVENATFYVDYDHKTRVYSGCRVKNDSAMVCQTPKSNAPVSESSATFSCGFRVDFAEEIRDLRPHFTEYRLFPDPEYTDFNVRGDTIVIDGRNLDRGFRTDDLRVRVDNVTTSQCRVIDQRQLVCDTFSSSGPVGDVREVVVTIGDNFVRNVKKITKPVIPRADTATNWFFYILVVGLLATMFVAILYYVILCYLKQKKVYDVSKNESLREKLPLKENQNAAEDIILETKSKA